MEKDDQMSEGFTLFAPSDVKLAYPAVDLQKKQVTATFSYKGKMYMTVHLDLTRDTIDVVADYEELAQLEIDKDIFINIFKSQAQYFIDNNIADPKKYFKHLE